MHRPLFISSLLITLAAAACTPPPTLTAVSPTPPPRPARLTRTPTHPPTRLPDSTSVGLPATLAAPAGDPLQPYYIDSLRARAYPGGRITLETTLEQNSAFTRYRIAYPSDGLRITGMMDLPAGPGPFPVIVLNHAYFDPAAYQTGQGTQAAADYFARHGYLTLASDYRIYGGSDAGSDPYRTGFATDVLNLIASVKSLPQAQPDHIGLWGHSMGGGIAIEVLVINPPGLRAVVLYGAMSGDIADNYRLIAQTRDNMSLGPDWAVAPDADPEAYFKLSPINYLHYATAPVQIHHGAQDLVVPPAWSLRLAQALADAGQSAAFYTYPNSGHWFQGDDWDTLLTRNLDFFDTYLKTP